MNTVLPTPAYLPFCRPRAEARPLWPVAGGPHRQISAKTVERLCNLAIAATASAFALPVGELSAPSRRGCYAAFARQCAMYLAHVAFGLNYCEIGRGFGRNRRTAAHACAVVEDRRDDPAVDRVIASLEDACGALRRRLDAPVHA